jgi:hypothetical protein
MAFEAGDTMKRTVLFLLSLVGVFVLTPLSVVQAQITDNWTFGTLPVNGVVSGEAGSTVGWGYTLQNQSSTYWLYAYDFFSDSLFQNGTTSVLFDYPILAPGATVIVPYDGASGLANLTWNADAPIGYVNSGNLIVNGAWYDNDPFNGGQFVDLAGFRSSSYQASVVSATTPEPNALTIYLIASGMAGMGWLRRRRK